VAWAFGDLLANGCLIVVEYDALDVLAELTGNGATDRAEVLAFVEWVGGISNIQAVFAVSDSETSNLYSVVKHDAGDSLDVAK
jgi:hypothetical protein